MTEPTRSFMSRWMKCVTQKRIRMMSEMHETEYIYLAFLSYSGKLCDIIIGIDGHTAIKIQSV